MRRLRSILKGRAGVTLVELIVSVMLLVLAIGMFAAALPAATHSVRRLEDLNNAQLVAENLLETLRGKLETAEGYVKCYADGAAIADTTGVTDGAAIEFRQENGYTALISADGCDATELRRVTSGEAGTTTDPVDPGYLLERYYYSPDSTYVFSEGATPIARALTTSYSEGAYMGFKAQTDFSLHLTAGGAAEAVTVTVTIYRDDPADPVLTDSAVIDLRYKPAYRSDVTAESST